MKYKTLNYIRSILLGILLILNLFAIIFLTEEVIDINKTLNNQEVSKSEIAINRPQEIDEPVLTEATKVEEIPSEEEAIDGFVDDIVLKYPNVSSSLVKSVIWHESRYNPEAVNYNETCFGLMQISSYWHKDRMERLGVKDLFDTYGNILVGVDYLSELIDKYEDPALALMLYNMRHDTAFKLYKQGKISDYAKSVIERATQLK